jgi:glutathione S-transferase
MRARLALLVSRTVCDIREVKLSQKPAEMIAASPKATVPVIVRTDGTAIEHSLDIMQWALAGHDPQAWLASDDSALIAANDGPFKHHLDRYKYSDRYGCDRLEHRAAGMEFLRTLDARLTHRANLCADTPGIADVAIFPFVRQFAETDRPWFETLPLPNVQAWLERHLRSALFAAAMVRLRPWRPGDEPIRLAQA